jgi:tRNA-dihydrouridine synthase
VCLEHARDLIGLKGENIAIKEMRALACFYVKGMPNASVKKTQINLVETYKDLEKTLVEYLEELEGL